MSQYHHQMKLQKEMLQKCIQVKIDGLRIVKAQNTKSGWKPSWPTRQTSQRTLCAGWEAI